MVAGDGLHSPGANANGGAGPKGQRHGWRESSNRCSPVPFLYRRLKNGGGDAIQQIA